MHKIKKKKFKIGDLVCIKRFKGISQNCYTIDDTYKQGKTIYYLIREFGRPTFLASDGPSLYRELEKIYLTQKEIEDIITCNVNTYLTYYGPSVLNAIILPKANKKSNPEKIKARLGII